MPNAVLNKSDVFICDKRESLSLVPSDVKLMGTLFFIRLNAILDDIYVQSKCNQIEVRGRQSLLARPNTPSPGCALSAVRSAQCGQDCFRLALLFCERPGTVSRGWGGFRRKGFPER